MFPSFLPPIERLTEPESIEFARQIQRADILTSLLLATIVRRSWTIDLLGFGFTERLPDCPFSSMSIRTHLEAFWQTKIQQPIILVGVSMGGAAAIEFTLNNPTAVHKLVSN